MSDTVKYSLDVEKFICEVQRYPVIWDINNEDNRYKTRKEKAWTQIARVFIKNYDEIPDIDKIDVCRKLICKWRNIRDSYVRHLKRNISKKGYMYAKYLTFLDTIYHRQGCNEGSDDDQVVIWASDEDIDKSKNINKRKQIEIVSDSRYWESDNEDTPSTIENLKRKRRKTSQEIEYVDTPFSDPSCNFTGEDEDRSFFESLLPAVREFNLDQKLEFRSEVILLLKNIRSNNGAKIKTDPEAGGY